MFSINKALHSDFPKPAEDLQRIFMPYIHAVIAEKRDPNCKNISPQLEKYFFSNWEIIFSQLSTAYRLNKYAKLPTMVSQILLRAHKTSLLKPNLQGKDVPCLLRPILVIY